MRGLGFAICATFAIGCGGSADGAVFDRVADTGFDTGTTTSGTTTGTSANDGTTGSIDAGGISDATGTSSTGSSGGTSTGATDTTGTTDATGSTGSASSAGATGIGNLDAGLPPPYPTVFDCYQAQYPICTGLTLTCTHESGAPLLLGTCPSKCDANARHPCFDDFAPTDAAPSVAITFKSNSQTTVDFSARIVNMSPTAMNSSMQVYYFFRQTNPMTLRAQALQSVRTSIFEDTVVNRSCTAAAYYPKGAPNGEGYVEVACPDVGATLTTLDATEIDITIEGSDAPDDDWSYVAGTSYLPDNKIVVTKGISNTIVAGAAPGYFAP